MMVFTVCVAAMMLFAPASSEPQTLEEIIAAANDFVQGSPSWEPEASGLPDTPATSEEVVDDLDPEAGLLPDAPEGEEGIALLADSIYYGSISTAVLDFASGLVAKHGYQDYVFFRSGQYTYDVYIGRIRLNGVFAGEDLLHVVYDTGTNYNSGPYVTFSRGDLELAPGNSLVYSNLGDYPALGEGVFQYGKAILFALALLLLFTLFRYMFPRNGK